MIPLVFIAAAATAELEPMHRRPTSSGQSREERYVGTALIPADVQRVRPRPSRRPVPDIAATSLLDTDVWAEVTGASRTESAVDDGRPGLTPQARDGTGLQPLATAETDGPAPRTAVPHDAYDVVRAAADHRIRLLAKRYGGHLTPEEDARLGILTARLDEVAPQVTDEDRAALTKLRAEQARVMADMDELLASLDI